MARLPRIVVPGKVSGFSLHAGVAARADQRDKLERLCRYISRPAVSEKRLSLTNNGLVRDQLKTPYRDGTTHVFFEPMDFLARLAALVPKPRVNLTRFHVVFAPNSHWRAQVTPAKRGKGRQSPGVGLEEKTPAEKHTAMTWAKGLKRVFDIDVQACEACSGAVRIVAAIEDPVAIKKILDHLAGIRASCPLTLFKFAPGEFVRARCRRHTIGRQCVAHRESRRLQSCKDDIPNQCASQSGGASFVLRSEKRRSAWLRGSKQAHSSRTLGSNRLASTRSHPKFDCWQGLGCSGLPEIGRLCYLYSLVTSYGRRDCGRAAAWWRPVT